MSAKLYTVIPTFVRIVLDYPQAPDNFVYQFNFIDIAAQRRD